jgi:hypothetical protein
VDGDGAGIPEVPGAAGAEEAKVRAAATRTTAPPISALPLLTRG